MIAIKGIDAHLLGRLPYLYVVLGLLGTIASAALTFDSYKIANNPAYQPSCDINPLISCGTVMRTPEATLLGFANSWVGLVAFPLLIAAGIALIKGVRFKKLFWRAALAAMVGGVLFVHFLFVQSVYHIHALCPYCMSVWLITMMTFWYTLLYMMRASHIEMRGAWARLQSYAHRHHADVLIAWAFAIGGLIVHQFWYFFQALV
jgi:uncharacterized membrane protein